MAEVFNNLQYLIDIEKEAYIKSNQQELLKYILKNKAEIGNSIEKPIIAMTIMAVIFDGKNFTPNLEIISDILLAIVNKVTYSTVQFIANQFFKSIFSWYSSKNKYEEGLLFFNGIKDSVDSPMFFSVKTYLMYFSYHTKNYSFITDMLSSIISFAAIEELIDNVDHAMYYYYKALIHLRFTEFDKAYISFSVCIQSFVLQKGILITALQLEAIKHIVIMSFIPSLEKYKSLNQFLFNKMYQLKNLKELEAYAKLYLDKGKNFANWIENNKLILKQSKLVGLTKIAYKENEKNRLMNALKKYKKIHLKTLTKILDLSEESVLFYLKTLVQKNEVNIKYDEVEKIIEVLAVDYCNENMFYKLKNDYACLTNENNDFANVIKLAKEVCLKKRKIDSTNFLDN